MSAATRGGRLPDPGLAAICARCTEPRQAHGGPRNYGACPDQSGLRAARFRLMEVDKPPPPDPPAERLPLMAKRRLRACVDQWPEAETSSYDPRCCRWPKSCSATIYDEDRVDESDLEPAVVAAPVRPVEPVVIAWRGLSPGDEYPADMLVSCSICGCAVERDDAARHQVWHEALAWVVGRRLAR